MSRFERDRLPWEYADGPAAGRDVPITNEPREEVSPGVPAQPETPPDSSSEPTEQVRPQGT